MIDTLSDVLGSVRLAHAVFHAIETSALTRAAPPSGSAIDPAPVPGVEHVIECLVVTEGSCWANLEGEPALQLEAGDVLVLPHRAAPVLSTLPHSRGLDGARVVRGFLGCEARPFAPLLSTLPRLLHLPGVAPRDSICRHLVELAVVESAQSAAGSDCMLARVGELLFAQIVRQYVAALPHENVGWLAGVRDPQIGRALQNLHERPAHSWTLEELAKKVGMSRSTLAERFAYFVGFPPIQYLAQWRIQLAASLLRSSESSLAEIAVRVGYGSEAALSRAFKRQLGVAPTPYRRGDQVWRKAS